MYKKHKLVHQKKDQAKADPQKAIFSQFYLSNCNSVKSNNQIGPGSPNDNLNFGTLKQQNQDEKQKVYAKQNESDKKTCDRNKEDYNNSPSYNDQQIETPPNHIKTKESQQTEEKLTKKSSNLQVTKKDVNDVQLKSSFTNENNFYLQLNQKTDRQQDIDNLSARQTLNLEFNEEEIIDINKGHQEQQNFLDFNINKQNICKSDPLNQLSWCSLKSMPKYFSQQSEIQSQYKGRSIQKDQKDVNQVIISEMKKLQQLMMNQKCDMYVDQLEVFISNFQKIQDDVLLECFQVLMPQYKEQNPQIYMQLLLLTSLVPKMVSTSQSGLVSVSSKSSQKSLGQHPNIVYKKDNVEELESMTFDIQRETIEKKLNQANVNLDIKMENLKKESSQLESLFEQTCSEVMKKFYSNKALASQVKVSQLFKKSQQYGIVKEDYRDFIIKEYAKQIERIDNKRKLYEKMMKESLHTQEPIHREKNLFQKKKQTKEEKQSKRKEKSKYREQDMKCTDTPNFKKKIQSY